VRTGADGAYRLTVLIGHRHASHAAFTCIAAAVAVGVLVDDSVDRLLGLAARPGRV
jgi:hypothetical protein